MKKNRWAIHSNHCIFPGGKEQGATLYIAGEQIAHIALDAPEGQPASAVPEPFGSFEVQDVGDTYVVPGLVDTHVHINEPGRTEWEGFETATMAAAAGGITSVFDMPLNCLPVTTSAKALQVKLEHVADKLHVDCGFWGGLTPQSMDDLDGLLRAGVFGVKSFTIDSGIVEFPPMRMEDLAKVAPVLKSHDLPLLVHAELDDGFRNDVGQDYHSFLDSRPDSWEVAAIEGVLKVARRHDLRVHIVHLSSAKALPVLRQARSEGVRISVETCPHYLCLQAEAIEDGQTLYKCCPPIRGDDNRQALWQGLEEGVIDAVVSDHSPCTANLKCLNKGDFSLAWGGISSLQFGLPLIWTQAKAQGIPLARLVTWMSEKTAWIAGVMEQKGGFEIGKDADIVLFDPHAQYSLNVEEILYKNKISPYLGQRVQGRVLQTYLRGRLIFADGKIKAPATGRPLMHCR